MDKLKDNQKPVATTKTGILELRHKKVKELEFSKLEAVCSACGHVDSYSLKEDTFSPESCKGCKRKIINIYASAQTGVLTAWVE